MSEGERNLVVAWSAGRRGAGAGSASATKHGNIGAVFLYCRKLLIESFLAVMPPGCGTSVGHPERNACYETVIRLAAAISGQWRLLPGDMHTGGGTLSIRTVPGPSAWKMAATWVTSAAMFRNLVHVSGSPRRRNRGRSHPRAGGGYASQGCHVSAWPGGLLEQRPLRGSVLNGWGIVGTPGTKRPLQNRNAHGDNDFRTAWLRPASVPSAAGAWARGTLATIHCHDPSHDHARGAVPGFLTVNRSMLCGRRCTRRSVGMQVAPGRAAAAAMPQPRPSPVPGRAESTDPSISSTPPGRPRWAGLPRSGLADPCEPCEAPTRPSWLLPTPRGGRAGVPRPACSTSWWWTTTCSLPAW